MSKTVLITGATSGIGAAYAEYYGKLGYTLVIVSRTEMNLKKQKEQLKKSFNVSVKYIVADLAKEYAAKGIYDRVQELGLFIDILINNAGIGFNGEVGTISLEKQHHETMLNSLALVDMCHLFVKGMKKKGTGTIVNLASTTAYYPVPHMAVYGASKAFVLSFTEALHGEYKKHGVKVLSVSPGPTDTNFFASDRGIAYGQLRKPTDVVATTMRGLRRNKTSVIDGTGNYFTSSFLPRIVSRKTLVGIISRIMGNLV